MIRALFKPSSPLPEVEDIRPAIVIVDGHEEVHQEPYDLTKVDNGFLEDWDPVRMSQAGLRVPSMGDFNPETNKLDASSEFERFNFEASEILNTKTE